MDTSRAKWKDLSINKITKIQVSLIYLVLPCKLDISIVVQIDRSLPRRVQNVHHRLLLAHEAVMISMIRGVEIAFAVDTMGSDEAFGVAKAGRRVALGDGVDCSCRHSRRGVISGIYLPWRGSGDVVCVLGRRVVLGSMSVLLIFKGMDDARVLYFLDGAFSHYAGKKRIGTPKRTCFPPSPSHTGLD